MGCSSKSLLKDLLADSLIHTTIERCNVQNAISVGMICCIKSGEVPLYVRYVVANGLSQEYTSL